MQTLMGLSKRKEKSNNSSLNKHCSIYKVYLQNRIIIEVHSTWSSSQGTKGDTRPGKGVDVAVFGGTHGLIWIRGICSIVFPVGSLTRGAKELERSPFIILSCLLVDSKTLWDGRLES